MTFLEAANSSFVYYVVGGVLLVVLLVLLNFLRIALAEAKRYGMDNKYIWTTVKTTLLVSIGPALSILLPFLALMALLGIPWSWLRLSVIGSMAMEMLLANMSLTFAGFQQLGVETSVAGFGICVLSIGFTCIAGMLINICFNKSFQKVMVKARSGSHADVANAIFGALFTGILLNNAVGVFVNNIPAGNFIPIAVFFTALGLSFLGNYLIKKYELKALKEYSFAIYLLLSMCSALLWNAVL